MSGYISTLVCLCTVFMLFPSSYNETISCNEPKEKHCHLKDIKDLAGVNVVACTGLHDNLTVCHKGHCNISIDRPRNGSSLLLYRNIPKSFIQICVNGRWSGTDTYHAIRAKRFLGPLIAAIAGIVVIGGTIVCAIFCGSGGSAEVRSPPSIEPCPPADIQTVYYVEVGETEMQINWTKPTAHGNSPSLVQVSGKESGDTFQGSVGGGRSYHINYEANDGLRAVCDFSFAVIVRSCEPAPWVTNGARNCPQHPILGATCTYECNDGYKLVGDSVVTCANDASPAWTQVPVCEGLTVIVIKYI